MKALKRIACIICAVLLTGLYMITLVFSITDHSQARSWLSASLYATVAIPIFLYAFLLITKQLQNKKQEEIPGSKEQNPEKNNSKKES